MIPKKYTVAVKRYLGLRAVWPPGSNWKIGDYVIRQDGYFRKIGNIGDRFKINIETDKEGSTEIKFMTSRVFITKIEAGTKVREFSANLAAEAELELKFKRAHSFYMHSKPSEAIDMKDKDGIGGQIAANLPGWRHGEWFVVSKVYGVDSFILLANQSSQNTVKVKGSVGELIQFLQASVSPEVRFRNLSNMALSILGKKSGPVVVELLKIKKDGNIDFV
jgi:hypothetical protein